MKPIILYCPTCDMQVKVPVQQEGTHVKFRPQDIGVDHVCRPVAKKVVGPKPRRPRQ